MLLTSMFYGFPMWLSAAMIIFAFNQNFGVGLVIMLGLVVVQLILSIAVSNLKWDEFSDFDFSRMSSDSKVGKRFNIVFNLTRVGTIISSLAFLFQSDLQINPFGGLGITISIVVAVIAVLSFLSFINFYDSPYKYVRGILSVLALIPLLVFSYLYFGTQLIWIPLFLSLAFSYSKGLMELEGEKYQVLTILTPVLLTITSLISTIIQFYQEIVSWFLESLDVISGIIVSFLTLEIFFIPLWLYLLVFVVIFTIIKVAKWSAKKSAAKKAYLAKLAEKAKEKEDKAKEEAERKANLKAKANSLLAIGANDVYSKENFIFLLENANQFFLEDSAIIWTRANLFSFFVTVSVIKEQIFYEQKLYDILDKFNYLYLGVKDDKILDGLISVISNLTEEVTKVSSFNGASLLIHNIKLRCKDFPQFQKKEEK